MKNVDNINVSERHPLFEIIPFTKPNVKKIEQATCGVGIKKVPKTVFIEGNCGGISSAASKLPEGRFS